MRISIARTFRVGIIRNDTINLILNQVFSNEHFCIFLEVSWIVVVIALASSILILILDLK